MKNARRIIDVLTLTFLGIAAYLFARGIDFILPQSASDEYALTLATTLLPLISGSLASIFGILIAVYMLSSQITGRRPYSRLVRTFYDLSDLYYFSLFFVSLLFPVYTHASWVHIASARQYYLLDVSLILYTTCILSLASLMLKHLSIFDPRLVAERALRIFNVRNVLEYGLVLVERNNYDNEIGYRLKTWGHRHNLSDPLGAFHDILMEAIEARERVTFHLYLSVLIEKLAYLNGVRFQRKFGLATGPKRYQALHDFLLKLPVVGGAGPIEHKIQVTIHALHYVVRRAHKMTKEWGLDNHRQIFIINIADLILALARNKDNAVLIEICLNALLRICMDYREIPIYGSYEPLKDVFGLAYALKKAGLIREANICLQVLAFLDINTPYISQNKNVITEDILSSLPSELVDYFVDHKNKLIGKKLEEVFENNVWRLV